MSLAGRTVLVTRPAAQGAALATLLTAAGAQPLAFPLLDIVPQPDALAALPALAGAADWLVFVSPSAIDVAWPVLAELPPAARLACVGAPSAQRLAALAGRPVLHPSNGADSGALLAEPALAELAGQRVLIVRGIGGRAELAEGLAARGAAVEFAEVYRRIDAAPDWAAFDSAADAGTLAAACVTSAEIAERLFQLAGRSRQATLQSLLYSVPHARIAERLAQLGARHVVTTPAGDAALVDGLSEWFQRHP
ncbi:uroporphyrinogen-III synthase [Crenobacter sp. SG2305]|uniref:uroporphyrinogen-III synthase n=1 Tax=Crenobacter oryzisoli TaxID=3056844 RepID=UPI0025AAFF28|nr:uroporphyrinogen-III synthase [Crenobacter sp. SG2305]MDN0081253.1 uroporphyrinogen-III synthase [Crenobacter sp. SG2305]